jgi:hypothetical protein
MLQHPLQMALNKSLHAGLGPSSDAVSFLTGRVSKGFDTSDFQNLSDQLSIDEPSSLYIPFV